MQHLEVQKYLFSGKTPEDLKNEFAIDFKVHPEYPNLIHFSYNQIESPMAERLVQECRGLVLDSANNWKVVCMAFQKFFNWQEGHAAKLDWSSVKYQTKLDGSLIFCWRYNGKWHVSTTGSPNAGGQIQTMSGLKFFDHTFGSYFWEVANEQLGVGWERKLPIDFCFFFELTSPFNKIVVNYTKPQITLLGARDLTNLKEHKVKDILAAFFCSEDITTPEVFEFFSIENAQKRLEELSPFEFEGYVLCDDNFNRIKLKSQKYVELHHLGSGLNVNKNLMEIVRKGEIDEVAANFPELKERLANLLFIYNGLVSEINNIYNQINHTDDMKKFAEMAKESKYASALFALKRKKADSVRSFLLDLNIKVFMSWMEELDLERTKYNKEDSLASQYAIDEEIAEQQRLKQGLEEGYKQDQMNLDWIDDINLEG